jgi:HEAT repeat protein
MAEREDSFLAGIEGDDADVRFAAWRRAGEMDPEVIPALGKLVGSPNLGVAKAATEALNTIAHSGGKQEGERRSVVARRLIDLTAAAQPPKARVLALRLLSLVGGEETIAPAAKLLRDRALQEEAVFCLERIPGKPVNAALLDGLKDAAPAFRPRILAALGHRRAEEAVPACVEAMRSPDKEMALAGLKAFARIGRKPAGAYRLPDSSGLSPWEQTEFMDSCLRYAGAQAEAGNHAEALKLYRTALDREEEHWQCAAVIGIARIGTAEAAAAIFPKLRSANSKVRITARKAWEGMAPRAAVDRRLAAL